MYYFFTHNAQFKIPLLSLTCLVAASLSGLTHAMSDDPKSPDNQAQKTTCIPNPLKNAFFGETHLHTGMSFDASLNLVPTTPRDAYAFAKGQTGIKRVGPNGYVREDGPIDRPLDWGAVTDHSEYFGEMGLCKYDQFGASGKSEPDGLKSLDCQLLNGFYWKPSGEPGETPRLMSDVMNQFSANAFGVLTMPSLGPSSLNTAIPLCRDKECNLSLWDEMQAAAEEANEPCNFTSFIGYEVTSSPASVNWHRNVIFANNEVVARPITAIDMARAENSDPDNIPPEWFGAPDVTRLWDGLQKECLDAGTGCDVITIPHNSNLGGGIKGLIPPMFFDPANKEDAEKRQKFEPLVEIYQDKGGSECRWDPRYKNDPSEVPGVNTNDEFCDFELLDVSGFASFVAGSGGGTVAPLPSSFNPRSYVRNVLKDGLLIEQNPSISVNPFKLGIIAASDSHNGDMGWNVEDARFNGHLGIKDANPVLPENIQFSSGGLSVVWAKENTRESIFAALKNRETYGTSGTRIKVRFFGGWDFSAASCDNPANLIRTGYKQGVGVPMGQDLPPKTSGAPQFIVQAEMDDFPVGEGTPLDRIQIIKGWVDGDTTHEKVFHVVGDRLTQDVNPNTCKSPEVGHQNLCQIFTDPEFDPTKPAFYYARVLEKPVCRYSTLYCRKNFDLDPLDPEACQDQLVKLAASDKKLDKIKAISGQACCSNETTTPIVQPVIQERAWTSPIWYTP